MPILSNITINKNKKMINSRIPEITIKFTQELTLPVEGKKVNIAFKSENGLNILAEVTRKTAAKQLKKTEEFEDWIGAVAGKIDKIENNTIFVIQASLQVFEKKPKPPKDSE